MKNGKVKRITSSVMLLFFSLYMTGITGLLAELYAAEDGAEAETSTSPPGDQLQSGGGGPETMDVEEQEGGDPGPQPSTPASTLNYVSGILNGFQVDQFTGSGVYNYPIAVPPGRGGLQPNINFIYNSSKGDGWLGMGWDLNLGYIQRSTKNGIPTYDNTQDEFVYVGPKGTVELVEIDTPNGRGEYRAKVEEAFLRFNFDDLDPGDWVMWDRNGTKYEFSQRFSPSPSGVFRWLLTRITDTHSNSVEIYYQTDWGDRTYIPSPYLIEYGGNVKVNFYVETRTDYDQSTDVSSGQPVVPNGRLKTISVQIDSDRDQNYEMVRAYDLTYEDSPESGRSLLNKITQYGDNAQLDGTGKIVAGSSIPATEFIYQKWEGGAFRNLDFDQLSPTIGCQNCWIPDRYDRYYLGNYDGYPSVFVFNHDKDKVYLLSYATTGYDSYLHEDWSASSIQKPSGGYWAFNESSDRFYPGDYNGDGTTDLFVCDLTGTQSLGLMISRPSDYPPFEMTWYIEPEGLQIPEDRYSMIPGDFNGDGKTDIYTYATGYTYMGAGLFLFHYYSAIYLSNGESFQVLSEEGGSQLYVPYPSKRFTPLDFNGDKKTDLFVFDYTNNIVELLEYNEDQEDFTVSWSDEDGNFDGIPLDQNDLFFPGEINGDGLSDLVQFNSSNLTLSLILSTGTGFDVEQIYSNFIDGRELHNDDYPYVGDFDGDGMLEIIMKIRNDIDRIISFEEYNCEFNGSNWYLDYLCDNSYCYSVVESLTDATVINLNDIRGGTSGYSSDRKLDLFAFNPERYSGDYYIYSMTMEGPIPDLLSSIQNGYGGSIDITYHAEPVNSPMNCKQAVYRTIVDDGVDDGFDNRVVNKYDYENGLYDPVEKEFYGFGKTIQTLYKDYQNRIVDNITETYFKQDESEGIYKGKPEKTIVKDAQGNLYRKVEYQWSHDDAWSGNSKFIHKDEDVTWYYRGDSPDELSSYYLLTYNDYQYDAYGNVIQVDEYFDDDGDSDFNDRQHYRRTVNEYVPNSSDWILGKLSHTQTFEASDTKYRESWCYYDGSLNYNTPPTVGDLTKVEQWLDGGANPTSKFQYDGYGNQTVVIDALGHQTSYTFDSSTNYTFPSTVTNAKGHQVSSTYDLGKGNVLSQTDTNGNTTTYTYDVFGRLKKVIKPGDSESYPTIEYAYNAFGDVDRQRISTYQRVYSGTSRKSRTCNYFDGLGRTLQTQRPFKKDPNDSTKVLEIRTDMVYDGRGRVVQVSLPYFAEDEYFTNGETRRIPPDSTVKWEITEYDLLDRPIQVTHPDGSYQHYQYYENNTTVTDENGHQKVFTYGPHGRLIQVEEINNQNHYYTNYTYNVMNEMTGIDDAQSNHWSYTYDTLGRRRSSDDPDRGYSQYFYDSVGNLTETVDGQGHHIYYFYDEINRLVSTSPNPDGSSPYESYIYDQGMKGIGLLTQQINETENISISFAYDNRGRVETRTQAAFGEFFTIEFQEYTAFDAPSRIKYPDNEIITYEFGYENGPDGYGLIHDIPNYVDEVEYTASLQRQSIQFANGVTTEYQYDADRLWLQKVHTFQTGNQIQDLSYTAYDNIGNILQILDNLDPAKNQDFGYDDLNRLTSAIGPYGTKSYIYDEVGNIVGKDGVSYTYNEHRLVSGTNGFTALYDQNGNMIISVDPETGTERDYTWDYQNRLTKVETPSIMTLYSYSPDGGRVRKVEIDDACEVCFCDLEDATEEELQASARDYMIYVGKLFDYEKVQSRSTKYVFLDNLRIASKNSAGEVRFYHSDHLGSARVITDGNGNVVDSLLYDPYGQLIQGGSSSPRYTFTGKELDDLSDLYFFGARYYAYTLGRFISADPAQPDLTNPQGLNPYSYCNNNPLKYVDPHGKIFFLVPFMLAALHAALYGAIQGAIMSAVMYQFVNPGDFGSGFFEAIKRGAIGGAITGGLGYMQGSLIKGVGSLLKLNEGNWVTQSLRNATFGAGVDVAQQLVTTNKVDVGQLIIQTLEAGSIPTTRGIGEYIGKEFNWGTGKQGGIAGIINNVYKQFEMAAATYLIPQALGGTILTPKTSETSSLEKMSDFFDPKKWIAQKNINGPFDFGHIAMGSMMGGIYRGMGFNSPGTLGASTAINLFYTYEASGEPNTEWEWGDFVSDVLGAVW